MYWGFAKAAGRHMSKRLITFLCVFFAGVVLARGPRARADDEPFAVLSARQKAASPATPPKPQPATQPGQTDPLQWTDGLKDGLALAQQSGRPVLVRAGAAWCGWCRKLDAEIAKPEVQKELARWTLAYIDIDRNPEDAATLSISGVPALRALTSTGRLVASQDGYVDADALVTWLGKRFDQAAMAVPAELKSDEPPDEVTLAKLLAQFDNRDPVLREAAIRRLAPHPDASAAGVVKAFVGGKLAVRLAALELLDGWKAPVEGLDPWQPESINAARLNALKEWVTRSGKMPTTRPESLDELRLAAAREELAAYLKAQSPAEVRAVRERLARYGLALLPEVLDRLKTADTDAATERLSALRYRLAAGDALALSWPDGFERLASMSAAPRQQAVEELTRLAGSADVPLLLELFGHPDPLVREIALRAMQTIGGAQTMDALVKLLHDPEPNVRAAVLKQLAEKPNRQLVPQIAEYVKTEKDPDLIVHAVRFLREAKGGAAIECLTALLSDESWRVRAEAAEAIGQCISDARSLSEEKKADVYVALVKLLDDPEGFVVYRAMEGLKAMGLNLAAAMEPLARAAAKHPELAGEISEMMSGAGERSAGLSHLRRFITNDDPAVRAAAITGLASSDPFSIDKELLATLQDKELSVRVAAAKALLQVLERSRPAERDARGGSLVISGEEFVQVESAPGILGGLFGGRRRTAKHVALQPASQPQSRPSTQPEGSELDTQSKWLADFRAGRGRPEWTNAMIPPLQKMLGGDFREEQIAAVVPLIALGVDGAFNWLWVDLGNNEDIQPTAIAALPWLPWEQRVQLFQLLLAFNAGPERLSELAAAMAKIPDLRAGDLLWDLLARPGLDESSATAIHQALSGLYFGEQYYSPESVPAAKRRRAAAAAAKRAAGGAALQRVMALSILLACDRAQAAERARAILQDSATSHDVQLRRDAGQVLLLADTGGGGAAVEALSSDVPELRQMALLFLAFGRAELRTLRGWIPVYMSYHDADEIAMYSASSPIEPKPPAGLKAEVVRPFLQDADAKSAACAGYLLALLGEADGLPTLIAYWREHGQAEEGCTRLVFRAIAALGDDAQIPILDEIYGQIGGEDHRIREFYWTVRIMKGPEALKFREKIRREVGTQRLR